MGLEQGEECEWWGSVRQGRPKSVGGRAGSARRMVTQKFHVNFFLNLSGFSAMCLFAEKLSMQPAVSLGIGPSEAAAVCSEPS